MICLAKTQIFNVHKKPSNSVKPYCYQGDCPKSLRECFQFIYFPEREINELKAFSEGFGAIPLIAIRFDRIGWFFVHIKDLGFSKTNHFISLELARKKGMNFDEVIGKYKQLKL